MIWTINFPMFVQLSLILWDFWEWHQVPTINAFTLVISDYQLMSLFRTRYVIRLWLNCVSHSHFTVVDQNVDQSTSFGLISPRLISWISFDDSSINLKKSRFSLCFWPTWRFYKSTDVRSFVRKLFSGSDY